METRRSARAAEHCLKILGGRGGASGSGAAGFADDVLNGLSGSPKSLPSRCFYDDRGNRLFQRIMELPEYYLTDCEVEILQRHKERIAGHFNGGNFNLVELGAGDGTKTMILLEHFMGNGLDFRYVPIDICREAVAGLVSHCRLTLPGMPIEGVVSEYSEGLRWLSGLERGRNVVLFLGSNIGNFSDGEARAFLEGLHGALRDGDLLLIGFDLRKDVDTLMQAYSDSEGVTAEFNLNLLQRINRELGGAFRSESFTHAPRYNPFSGAMESYLLSREAQSVPVEKLGRSFFFRRGESIHTEISRKYLPEEIRALVGETGFEVVDELKDSRGYFTDSLWRVSRILRDDGATVGT